MGAGRGLLARERVRLGFAVAALDPDPQAARLGRETGARERLAVDCEVGDAGRLPYADGSFDVGYWADTLEIARELDVVLAEPARVLRPGGVVVYDTVTRTALSRLIYLGALRS